MTRWTNIISGEAGGQPQQELQQDLHHQPPGIDMKLTPTPREFYMTAKSEQKKMYMREHCCIRTTKNNLYNVGSVSIAKFLTLRCHWNRRIKNLKLSIRIYPRNRIWEFKKSLSSNSRYFTDLDGLVMWEKKVQWVNSSWHRLFIVACYIVVILL